ncbi:MAG TPA: LLM class flavin-dependent oxidoreductase [Candidatus Limnocylindria bacterium]|nr:LLM class flavin-dependent oxidoreductase [Candidatus Limnocylindria bacterium]
MTLQVGLGTLSGQIPFGDTRRPAGVYAEMLELARLAEEVGFDSFWVSSHHGAPNAHLPSPIVLLAAAAAVTRRIALGAAMVIAPLQHPLRLAEDCAVADQLSRGRLVVGLGTGWRAEEFAAFGIPMGERAGRTAEVARICRMAWDHGRVSFAGTHYRFDDVAVTPQPYGHVPIVMGGSAPSALARAGRLADGFLATGMPQKGLDAFRAEVATFDRAAREAGRDPSRLFIGANVNAWISSDGTVPRSVREAMWHKIGTSLAWHAGRATEREEDVPPLDDAHVRERAFLGTPEEVIRQAAPWVAAFPGRDVHLLARLYHPGMTAAEAVPAVRLFGERVIPELKRIHATTSMRELAT